jgi:hypothetical protein
VPVVSDVFEYGAFAFAPGPRADLIAAIEVKGDAERGSTISVWSLVQRKRIARFTTEPDYGSTHLALIGDAPAQVIAAAWYETGVSAFDLAGTVTWQRRDLKKATLGKPFRDMGGKSALVIRCEDEPAVIVNAHTGKNRSLPLRGVTEGFCNVDRAVALYVQNKSVRIDRVQPQSSVRIRLSSFAVLDAAFSEDAVAFLEVGGKLRCFDWAGAPRWQYAFGEHARPTSLAWSADRRRWVTLVGTADASFSGGVFSIDETGKLVERVETSHCADAELAPSGDAVVDTTGRVFDPFTGRDIYRLAPQREPEPKPRAKPAARSARPARKLRARGR